MPTVAGFNRCRITMYFADHPPPHFHIITNDDRECVYRIDTLELWDGDCARDADEALAWAAANREELYRRWLEYSEQEA
jgi:Domain of unknown function (DUF4160)